MKTHDTKTADSKPDNQKANSKKANTMKTENKNQNKNQNQNKKNKSGKKFPWKKALITCCIIFCFMLILFAGTVWHLIATAPDIDSITVSPVESATYICDAEGNYLRKLTLASSNRDIVTLEEIPESLQHAVIAIEDERFYEHGGIDTRGILRAFWKGITHASFSEGASTITQQLIKNNVFTEWTQENSFRDRFSRKIQEQYLALQLENRISKEEILTDYLNTINLGSGCYGVQSAARRYFGKDVSRLTLSESAVLAAIPQNPTGYNPITSPDNNRRRQEIILEYMEDQDYITTEEKKAALSDDVYTRIRAFDASYEDASPYSYYEDALISQVCDLLVSEKGYSSEQAYRAVYSGGLRICTAQDAAIQKICDEEFQNPENFPEGTEYGIDYALSVSDEKGEVTHYSSENLRQYIRQTQNPDFDLLCSTREEAQLYADLFREHILAFASADVKSENNNLKDANSKDDINSQEDETNESIENTLTVLGERLSLSPQPQASLVLMEQDTGYVRAIVGGRGEKTASLTLNRATETVRQPGSTFKILTAYAPAIEQFGYTLASTFENEPYEYQDGTPVSNWDVNDYSGTVTVREAITRSINVVAVKCITAIAPRTGYDYARNFGISTLTDGSDGSGATDIIQPLALGGITRGVTNLELCSAYAAVANGGTYIAPRFFTQVLDRYGNTILDSERDASSRTRRVLSDATSYLLTSAMQDVVSDSSGTAYGTISAGGHPVAGKTGTTSDYKDIWFAGYTPSYTCCVWGGYDNNQDLPLVSTSHIYNRILWSSVMDRVHSGLPAEEFRIPDSVTKVRLCRDSHLPALKNECPNTYTEYFAPGTQPETVCSLHTPAPETESVIIPPDFWETLHPDTEKDTEEMTEKESDTESEDSAPTESGSESDLPPQSDTNMDLPPQSGTGTPPGTDSGTIIPPQSGTDTPPGTDSGTGHPSQSESGAPSGPEPETTLPPQSDPVTDSTPDSAPGTNSAPESDTGTDLPSETGFDTQLQSANSPETASETNSLDDLLRRLSEYNY